MKKLVLLGLLLAACSDDPTDVECMLPYACEVEGVDLAVLSVRADSVVASEVLASVLDARNIDVEFVVVNRGDQTAPASDVVVTAFALTGTVRIPSLAPGDTAVGHAPFTIERAYLYAGRDADASNITAEVLSVDAEPGNNLLTSPLYTLNIPYVVVSPILEPPQTTSLADGGRVWVRWTWEQSPVSFPLAPAVTFLVCLRRGTATCTDGSWQALGRLEPTNFQFISRFALITAAGAATPITGDYEVLICTVPRSFTGIRIDMSNPDHHCELAGSVTVVP